MPSTNLPDGVSVDDILGNRPMDHEVNRIWAWWWSGHRVRIDWLSDHFRLKGFPDMDRRLGLANHGDELHHALLAAQALAAEHGLVAAEGEACDLLASLPPLDPHDAVAQAEDEFHGV